MLTEAFDGKEPLVITHYRGNTDQFQMQPYAFLIGKNIDKTSAIKILKLKILMFLTQLFLAMNLN